MSDVYLWETYEKVGKEALERRDFSQAVESFKSAVTLAEKLPGEDQKLVMSLRHLSGATAKSGQLSLAFELLQKTDEIAGKRLGKSHSESVLVKRELYDLARQLGFLEQAEAHLVEVLAVVRALGETEEFLEVLELLAQLAGERERLDDAAVLYKEIVDARASLYGDDHPSVAQALLWHSTALSRSGQGQAAEEPLTRAFDMLELQFADDPKNLAQSLMAGAELMTSSGRPHKALEHQKRALDLLAGVLDENHQTLWDTREMLASTLASLGQLDESIEILEFCLQRREGSRDHRTAGLMKNLAGLYLTTGKLDKAETLYSQASELLNETLGPDHPATLAALEERVQLYHFSGRSQQALDLALTTIRSTEQRYGAGHPNTAQVYASTAVLAHASKRWDTAYELMKAAEAIWETLIPRPDDVLANCRLNLATCLIELGRGLDALEALSRIHPPAGSPAEAMVSELTSRAQAKAIEAAAPSSPEADDFPPFEGESVFEDALDDPFSDLPEPEPVDTLPPARAAEEGDSYPEPSFEAVFSDEPRDEDSFDSAEYALPDILDPAEERQDGEGETAGEGELGGEGSAVEGEGYAADPFSLELDDLVTPDLPSSEGDESPLVPSTQGPPAEVTSTGDSSADKSLAGDESMPTHDFTRDFESRPAPEPMRDSQSGLESDQDAEPASEHESVHEADPDAAVVEPNVGGGEIVGAAPATAEPASERDTLEPDSEALSDHPSLVEPSQDSEGEAPEELSLDGPAALEPEAEPAAYNPEEDADRRQHRRFNLGLNRFFDLSVRNQLEELSVVRSFLVDLSAGGLRVNSERPLPTSQTFELSLPEDLLGQEITVPARVTWQRALFGASYLQGVEFVDVNDDQRALIEAVLGQGDLSEGGRQHFRLYRPFPMQISQPGEEWQSSYASDLSVEGVGTRLGAELSAGQDVRLRLGLDFELPTVEVSATVAWSRSGDNGVSHGLRFEDVGPVEARTIKLFIDRCLELSPD